MKLSKTENSNDWYLEHPISETLLTGPPGCGKTTSIAKWVKVLVQNGSIEKPYQALLLTFSRKAKANLQVHLKRELGPRWREWVNLHNFHSWARYLYYYHHMDIDENPRDLAAPELAIEEKKKSICSNSHEKTDLDRILRECKVGAFSDDDVKLRIEKYREHKLYPKVIKYESWLRSLQKVDFDDQLRLGLLVLLSREVQSHYSEKFSLVVVDEVQDLSQGHFDLVAQIGRDRTLWAGDSEQGIYEFAGADPQKILNEIRKRDPKHRVLDISFRSSPPVLRVVNTLRNELALIQDQNIPDILAQEPDEWSAACLYSLNSSNSEKEAEWVVSKAKHWLDENSAMSVAITARLNNRLKQIEDEVIHQNVRPIIWRMMSYEPQTIDFIRQNIKGIEKNIPTAEKVRILWKNCMQDIDMNKIDQYESDPDDELRELFSKIKYLCGLMPGFDSPLSLEDVIEQISAASISEKPVSPGLHILNGHLAKGQEFDRVIIVGLEDGCVPAFFVDRENQKEMRSELSALYVMASRAKEQLVIATCKNVAGYPQEPSPWFGLIDGCVDEGKRKCLE